MNNSNLFFLKSSVRSLHSGSLAVVASTLGLVGAVVGAGVGAAGDGEVVAAAGVGFGAEVLV